MDEEGFKEKHDIEMMIHIRYLLLHGEEGTIVKTTWRRSFCGVHFVDFRTFLGYFEGKYSVRIL